MLHCSHLGGIGRASCSSSTLSSTSTWLSNDSCSSCGSSRAHCPWTARGPPVGPEQIRKKSQLPKTQCTYFDIFSRKTLNTWSNRSSFSQLQVHRLIEERGLSRSSCSGCARSSILAKFMTDLSPYVQYFTCRCSWCRCDVNCTKFERRDMLLHSL